MDSSVRAKVDHSVAILIFMAFVVGAVMVWNSKPGGDRVMNDSLIALFVYVQVKNGKNG